MGGIGAAAGAFEGDVENAAQTARIRALNLQQQQQNESARQFNANLGARKSELAQGQANADRAFTANRQDQAAGQSNLDRTFTAGRQDQAFDQKRTMEADARATKASEWDIEIKKKQDEEAKLRIEANKNILKAHEDADRKEKEALANRTAFAQSGIGAVALAAKKGSGIASAQSIALFNQQQKESGTGIVMTSGYWAPDGFHFKRQGPAVDGNGQPVEGKVQEYDEVLPHEKAYSLVKDFFGEDEAKVFDSNVTATSKAAADVERRQNATPMSLQAELTKLITTIPKLDPDTPEREIAMERLQQIREQLKAQNSAGAKKGGEADPRIEKIASELVARAKQLYPNNAETQRAWFKKEYDRQISFLKDQDSKK
jgi:hypothetical protein